MLDARDLLVISDRDVLRVMGGADDSVNSPDDVWTRNEGGAVDIDGQQYNRWDFGQATLFVDADIALNNVAGGGSSFAGFQDVTFGVQNQSFTFGLEMTAITAGYSFGERIGTSYALEPLPQDIIAPV